MKLLRKLKWINLVPWFIGLITVSLLLYLFTLITNHDQGETHNRDIIEILTTIFATFIGATAAFALERWNQKRTIHENNIVAANKAILVIGQIYSFYATYKKQFVDPARRAPFAWLIMQPSIVGPKEKINFDANSLYFLLETKDPNILGILLTEEQKFHTLLESIRKRDNLVEQRLRPKLEELEIDENTTLSEEVIGKIEQAIGPDLRITCKRLTEDIIGSLDAHIDDLKRAQKSLMNLLRSEFSASKFIKAEFVE